MEKKEEEEEVRVWIGKLVKVFKSGESFTVFKNDE